MKTENQIQNEIIDYLTGCGFIVHRMQSGKVKVKGGWMKLCPEGTPDLFAVGRNGKTVWIEVKTENGIVSDKQQEQICELIKRGQDVYVTRDVEKLKEVVF